MISRIQKFYRIKNLKTRTLKQSGYHVPDRCLVRHALSFIAINIKREARYYAFENIKSFFIAIINP